MVSKQMGRREGNVNLWEASLQDRRVLRQRMLLPRVPWPPSLCHNPFVSPFPKPDCYILEVMAGVTGKYGKEMSIFCCMWFLFVFFLSMSLTQFFHDIIYCRLLEECARSYMSSSKMGLDGHLVLVSRTGKHRYLYKIQAYHLFIHVYHGKITCDGWLVG